MLELTQAQLDQLDELEKRQYVSEVCKDAIKEHPELAESPGLLMDRLVRAYRYAVGIGFTDGPTITQFLHYEAVAPNFYQESAISRWLRKSGNSPEQRFEDLLIVARHRMKGY